MKQKIIWVALALLLPGMAWAADKPTTETVKSVLNYYHTGQEVILLESKLCTEIIKDGENKNECSGELSTQQVSKGQKVFLWMNYFIPGDTIEKATVLMQFSRKGKVFNSRELSMPQSIRYRTWRLLSTRKTGDWSVNIEQEQENGYLSLGTVNYSVVEAAATME